MKNLKLCLVGLGLILLSFNSCSDDLNTKPKVELDLEQLLQRDPNAIKGLVSKIYGAFALSGPKGPGSTDLGAGDDPGESPFLRGIINLQEFTADGMKNRWGDNGLDQLTTTSKWDENNKFFKYLYNRVYFVVPQSNNLLNVLNSVTVPDQELYKSELRYLRALAYYYMIDCFGKGVIATEKDLGSGVPIKESSRTEMFEYVEKELLAIEPIIPIKNEYGRANKSAVRMLLAKLYLNAQVYTGTPKYNEALTYSNKIITEGGFTLAPKFVSLFSGDNDKTAAKNEIIYALIADPIVSQSYGNTTYIVNGNLSSVTMPLTTFGATDGWQGHRATKAWYGLFGSSATDLTNSSDDRAKLFWTTGHNFEMTDYKLWEDGYPSVKFRNTNFQGTNSPISFSNTDFPLFRLADVYLMYAECVLRGATGGSNAQALDYVNKVRNRSNAASITAANLNLNFILDERARELNLEGHRRTDLIRFGKFTGGSYLWPWKGGSKDGISIPDSYKLFPIPLTALQSNPNLTQNPGY
ncbi:RagB/SusD family nutrient uptake outer membrane protein [Flavobacterium sp. TSSA_36]|uniref:RagB/SusD family nutrient uptake outer membrane protein n=1 Tax=Flavobacterium sp. TSSA_36 TaxID=3447669 RepID=UPI003F37CC80